MSFQFFSILTEDSWLLWWHRCKLCGINWFLGCVHHLVHRFPNCIVGDTTNILKVISHTIRYLQHKHKTNSSFSVDRMGLQMWKQATYP